MAEEKAFSRREETLMAALHAESKRVIEFRKLLDAERAKVAELTRRFDHEKTKAAQAIGSLYRDDGVSWEEVATMADAKVAELRRALEDVLDDWQHEPRGRLTPSVLQAAQDALAKVAP